MLLEQISKIKITVSTTRGNRYMGDKLYSAATHQRTAGKTYFKDPLQPAGLSDAPIENIPTERLGELQLLRVIIYILSFIHAS